MTTRDAATIKALLSHAREAHRSGDVLASELACWRVLQIAPDNSEALHLLGLLHGECGNYGLAATLLRRAVALDPGEASYHYNLGNVLVASGQVEQGIASLRHALELRPDYHRAHSGLYVALHYSALCDPRARHAQALGWARRYADPLTPAPATPVDPDPHRRLRIGYVSGELRGHPVGYFLEPVIEAHDRVAYEVYCYSNDPRSDALTDRLRALSDRWRDVWSLSDAELCELVRRDGIDILVDLSWHLGAHRLLAFARRPAPVQVTWLAAINTTGMRAMDYLVGDQHLCPPGIDDLYTERLVRLSRFYLPCNPPPDLPGWAPADPLGRGFPVFGCFNRLSKIGPEVLDLWAKILLALPRARLRLIATGLQDPVTSSRLVRALEDRGVAGERLELLGPMPRDDLLAAYNGIDVALDTLPYSGCTTSLEALWMGVPVVTLEGVDMAGRATSSLLRWAGLQELVARTQEEYIEIALGLGRDLGTLARLREHLRRWLRSVSMSDQGSFTAELEDAYRRMWRDACQTADGRQGA